MVYADGIKEYIEQAQTAQAGKPRDEELIGVRASIPSVRADLEVALHRNRELREEVGRLKTLLRERLGTELVGESVHRLRAQIDALQDANIRLIAERDAAVEERDVLAGRLNAADDDLTAARQSLRQMIRVQNESTI